MTTSGLLRDLDLGSSTFCLSDPAMTLRTNLSTRFTVSENIFISEDSEMFAGILKSREAWVAPAPDLVLHLQIQVNGDFERHMNSYINLISGIIQNAKVCPVPS
jgi:aspartyl aminopeptidase